MKAAKVVGVDGPTQVPLHVSEDTEEIRILERAGLCTMRKRPGYEWLKSLPPLKSHFVNGWNH